VRIKRLSSYKDEIEIQLETAKSLIQTKTSNVNILEERLESKMMEVNRNYSTLMTKMSQISYEQEV
jgi:hypothetical protein